MPSYSNVELALRRRRSSGFLRNTPSAALTEAITDGGSEADGKLSLDIAAPRRESARRAWRRKVRLGKSLTLLRLVKAVYTFDGGVDYLIWKAERHSGRKIDVSAFARAHPILCSPVVFWRAWRQGVFR